VLVRAARSVGATPIIHVDEAYEIGDVGMSAAGTAFTLRSAGGEARVTTPLLGIHQARNTTVAIAAVHALGGDFCSDLSSISSALSKVFLPGRFQRQGRFIFDVAHNPAGARTVADTLRAMDAPAPRTTVVAVLSDKDWRGIIRALAPVTDRFIITNAPSAPPDRIWSARAAHAFAESEGWASRLAPQLDAALALAQQSEGTIVITGSFHTVGDAMSRLQVSPFAA
jgi:dihydrofolate synthase/folylpolyglutamate synthase